MPPFENTAAVYASFNLPPNQNPLSDGGKWRPYSDRPTLKASSSGHSIHGTVDFPVCGSLYIGEIFLPPIIEAYGCRPESGLGAANESHRIVALFGNPDAYTGYSSGFGGGIGEDYFFRRYTGGTGSWDSAGDWGTMTVVEPSPGRPQKLGIRITASAVEQWGYYSGAWHLIQYSDDTTYRGPCWIALETEEQGGTQEVAWTCFFAKTHRTQFYRWMPSIRKPIAAP